MFNDKRRHHVEYAQQFLGGHYAESEERKTPHLLITMIDGTVMSIYWVPAQNVYKAYYPHRSPMQKSCDFTRRELNTLTDPENPITRFIAFQVLPTYNNYSDSSWKKRRRYP